MEAVMARPSNLSLLSIDALFKLRDDISAVLSRKTDELKTQLSRLTDGDWGSSGRATGRKASGLKGRKAPIKYRDKSGNHWSGRGAQPRWMTAAIKAGAHRDDFLIDRPRVAASRKTSSAKKSRRKKK
jgi:DNA-binding protein H-NS